MQSCVWFVLLCGVLFGTPCPNTFHTDPIDFSDWLSCKLFSHCTYNSRSFRLTLYIWLRMPMKQWRNNKFPLHPSAALYISIIFFIFLFSEASCASVVRAARGFVEDVGAPAASKSGGLLDLARRSENNAERDCARLMVNQFELSLPIPKTTLDTGVPDDDLSVPVLRLRDWVDFLVRGNHTHILVGLKKPNWKREEAILSAFWANFER